MTVSADSRTTARRFYDEVFNEGRLDVLDEIIAPDYVDHDPQNPYGDVRGPQGAKELVSMYRQAFPDVHFTIDQMLAEGDMVVTRWRATGTHSGELMGLAPTGKRVEVAGITMDRIVDGMTLEGWTYWDTLGMMQQIGAAPTRGSVGEKVGIQVQRLTARRFRKQAGVRA
ncbi:MAG: ester cyclase [Thermoleophilaceae bacterium]